MVGLLGGVRWWPPVRRRLRSRPLVPRRRQAPRDRVALGRADAVSGTEHRHVRAARLGQSVRCGPDHPAGHPLPRRAQLPRAPGRRLPRAAVHPAPADRRGAAPGPGERARRGVQPQGVRLLPPEAGRGGLRPVGARRCRPEDEGRVLSRAWTSRSCSTWATSAAAQHHTAAAARSTSPWWRCRRGRSDRTCRANRSCPARRRSTSGSRTTPSTWAPGTTASTPSRTPWTPGSAGLRGTIGCGSSV